MLRLLLGRDWTANRDEILNRVALDVQCCRSNRIILVPELISHDMERRLCTAAGDTASRFAEVLSFTRLANRVAEYAGTALEDCLDNGGRIVAMAAAARQLHSRLKAYAAVETKPEFLANLIDAVDEFKRCCINSSDLLEASKQTQGAFSQKLEELALLFDAYEGICAQGKRDPRDQMSWLLEQMEDCTFAQNHTFYIDGFPDFTRQHMAILLHLIQFSPEVTISLNCDCIESNLFSFEKAAMTASELIRCTQRVGVDLNVETVDEYEVPMLELHHKLFQGQINHGSYDETRLKVNQCESEFQECTVAAEEILNLVQSGCRYRDIGVVCTDIGTYKPLLEFIFHRCSIPVYISGTEDILQKSAIVTVLSALNAALGGFEQRDVLRYLKSAFSPLDINICDEIENYAVIWGIRRDLWLKEWKNHPEGLSGIWTDAMYEKLDMLNRAREMVMQPLADLRNGFKNAANLSEQVGALYRYLDDIQLAQRLSELADELEAKGEPREAQVLNQLWEILLTALEQMYDVLGDTVWKPDAFVRMFSLLLSQYDVGTIPPVLDAVMAGQVSAMRCQQSKHLIVLGAQEGALPGYTGSAGILTDQERVALREMGVPLTGGAMEGMQAEFSEIYGIFCGASESVSISCPTGQPSFVYRRLADMAGAIHTVTEELGTALIHPADAASYLTHWNGEEAADILGISEEYRRICSQRDHVLGTVSQDGIRKLYGSRLELSATQIDRQAECRFSYFLRYGLRAKERKEATVDPAEFGSYVHAVLENTVSEVQAQGGFHHVSLDQMKILAEQYSNQYLHDHFSQLDSQRLSYLFLRNIQEMNLVLQELWQELNQSDFEPKEFELSFGNNGKLPAIDISGCNMHAVLRGIVDRIDVWNCKNKHYFRVIDYKTGKKDFDYCDIFNGVGLQMLLYLFALEDAGEAFLHKNPEPAGVLYFPARVPYIGTDGRVTDEEAEEIRRKEWKRRGLLLDDEQVIHAMENTEDPKRLCCSRKKDGHLYGDLASMGQLKQLKKYLFRFLGKMVDEIASGYIAPNPYTRGTSHNACAYCPYTEVCHGMDLAGRRNFKTMSSQRFWDEIGKEVSHE